MMPYTLFQNVACVSSLVFFNVRSRHKCFIKTYTSQILVFEYYLVVKLYLFQL